MKKKRIASALLFAASLTAQDKKAAPAPPDDVDKALRSRVDFFYQAHVDGKFRRADQVVAEESKDDFFAWPKQRYEMCQITEIAYAEDFKTAHVVNACKVELVVRGTKFVTLAPIPSDWKQQDGQWFWYYKRPDVVMSPFGPMPVRDPKAGGEPAPLPRIDPAVMGREILKQVRADKSEVLLDPARAGSVQVKISNGMPGTIQISVSSPGDIEGLRVTADQASIAGGSTGTVTVAYTPMGQTPSGSARYGIVVQPTGQLIPLVIKFPPINK